MEGSTSSDEFESLDRRPRRFVGIRFHHDRHDTVASRQEKYDGSDVVVSSLTTASSRPLRIDELAGQTTFDSIAAAHEEPVASAVVRQPIDRAVIENRRVVQDVGAIQTAAVMTSAGRLCDGSKKESRRRASNRGFLNVQFVEFLELLDVAAPRIVARPPLGIATCQVARIERRQVRPKDRPARAPSR